LGANKTSKNRTARRFRPRDGLARDHVDFATVNVIIAQTPEKLRDPAGARLHWPPFWPV